MVACSSDDDAPATPRAAGGASGAGGADGGLPIEADAPESPLPGPDPAAPTVTDVPTATFAVTELLTTLDGKQPTPTTWEHAANLDGLHFTDKKQPGHCKESIAVVDGPGGRDNSFVVNVAPVFLGFSPVLGQETQTAFSQGQFSIVIRVRNLGAASSLNGLSVDALAARGGGGWKPIADVSTYVWHPLSDGLSQASGAGDDLVALGTSKSAYLVQNQLIADGMDLVEVPLSMQDRLLLIPVRRARVVATLSADHRTMETVRVDGVIDRDELLARFQSYLASLDLLLCKNSDNIMLQLRRACDLMRDGTQDPNAECTGVSIGLGFRAHASLVGTSTPSEAPTACTP